MKNLIKREQSECICFAESENSRTKFKRMVFSLMAMACVLTLPAQSVYDFKVKDDVGKEVSLSDYNGNRRIHQRLWFCQLTSRRHNHLQERRVQSVPSALFFFANNLAVSKLYANFAEHIATIYLYGYIYQHRKRWVSESP